MNKKEEIEFRKNVLPYMYIIENDDMVFKNRNYKELFRLKLTDERLERVKKIAKKHSNYFYDDSFSEKEKLKKADLADSIC